MKVHKKGLYMLIYCLHIYSMEKNNNFEKVFSLKYLASKKVWEHQELFFSWKEDAIEWKLISPDVYLDILQHGIATPAMIMNVLKNAQPYATQKFIQHITESILLYEPIKFIETLDHKNFSVHQEGYLKSTMVTILAKKYAKVLPEVKIRPQTYASRCSFNEQLNMLLGNVRRDQVHFDHKDFMLAVTDDFRLQKTDKENQAKEYYSGHTSPIVKLFCDPEGTYAVTGDVHGQVWYWNFAKGVGKKIGQHVGPVCGIKADNFLIASFATDKTVRLYSLLTDAVIKIEGLQQPIAHINFDRKKPTLYINFNEDSVKVSYPERYLCGAFSPEQLIVLGVFKSLHEGEKIDNRLVPTFKNVLKKCMFEQSVQAYLEHESMVFQEN